MVLPLLLAWSATIQGTTTIVGPDGAPEVRVAVVEATMEGDEDGFVYMLDHGDAGPATMLSCPRSEEAAFLAGLAVSQEVCTLLVRAAGGATFAPAFSSGRWEEARFPFHLLAMAGAGEPWEGEGEGAPAAVRELLPDLAREREMTDAVGVASVRRRLEYSGRVWTHPSLPLPVAGRVRTRMYFATQGKVGGVWTPFTRQTLAFFVEPWALPPEAEPPAAALPVAVVETNRGEFSIRLFTDRAPLTAGNFIRLAEAGFFDGTICHRVVAGFVDQCGDPTGTGWGGPGYSFANETGEGLRHDPMMVSMANSGPDSNGSQWFVTMGRIPRLDGNYSVFGEVVTGQEIVRAINRVPTDEADRPIFPVIIYSVTIEGEHETPPFPPMSGSLGTALVHGGKVIAAAAAGDLAEGAVREGTVAARPTAPGLLVEMVFAGAEGPGQTSTEYLFDLTGMVPLLVLPGGMGEIAAERWALPGSWVFHDGAMGVDLVVWPGEAGLSSGEGDLYHMAWRRPGLLGLTPLAGLVVYRESPDPEPASG